MFFLGQKREKKDDKETKPTKRGRRKKEPAKPWGKPERILTFLVLVIIPILSLIVAVRSRNNLNSNLALGTTSIINNITPKNNLDVDKLKQELASQTQGLTGTYGIWLQAIDGSFSLGISQNDKFEGASLFKVPLMIAYYQKVDKGDLNPSSSYTLKYVDKQAGSGKLSSLPAGTILTYSDLVKEMAQSSDNTAFEIMGKIVGWNSINQVIKEIGMTNTSFDKSSTTPYDTGLLFLKLEKGNLISTKSKNELLNFLTNTQFENLIPAGIPKDIQVAHKYAASGSELNDAGIIFVKGKPFILVVLSKNINFSQAQTAIPNIAKIVYNWLTK